MSAEATGWVWRSSPYRGAQLLVHLAIADVANDAHGNELWMSAENLAVKAKVSRSTVNDTLGDMILLGLLRLIERGGGRSRTTRYEFLMPETVQPPGSKETAQPATETAQSSATNCPESARNTKEQKEPNPLAPSEPRARPRNELWDAIARACLLPLDASKLTKAAKGMLVAATADIRKVGGLPEEVPDVAALYHRRFSGANLTPTALAKWWPALIGEVEQEEQPHRSTYDDDRRAR